MTGPVLAGGVMKEFSDPGHLLGPFQRLGLVDDEKAFSPMLAIETFEGVESDLLNHPGTVPVALPEKLAVLGSMGGVSQKFTERVESGAMADRDGQHQLPKMSKGGLAEPGFDGTKKTVDFLGHPADSNHAAYSPISICYPSIYRRNKPHFCYDFPYHCFKNRSI